MELHAEDEEASEKPAQLTDAIQDTAYEEALTTKLTGTITWSLKETETEPVTNPEAKKDTETKEPLIGLPDGIRLKEDHLIGTPTKTGTWNFTLIANNGKEKEENDYLLTVKEKAEEPELIKPTVTTKELPKGIVDKAYEAKLTADGTAPITWEAKDDTALPDGISLKDDILTGTPTKAGSYSFTLIAKNEAGTAEQAFELTVAEAPVKPAITTKELPEATVGKTYSAALEADGTRPITWSAKDEAALPDGIIFADGKLTGIPTKSGTYKFTILAKNEAGTAEQVYTLVIKEAEKAYTITVTTDGGGNAFASVPQAAEGTKITLSVSAKEGYTFKEWKVLEGTITIKDNTFLMPKENVSVKAIFEKKAVTYKVTKGSGGIHQIGDGKALSFTCSGDPKDLTGIYVDKSLVNSTYYTLKSENGTVVILKAEYLDKLKVGTHTLKFKYGDASAEASFKITAKSAVKTGDTTSVLIWLFSLGIAAIAVAAIIIQKRRSIK